MGVEVTIKARFNNQSDLKEFLKFLADETGGGPVDVDGLLVEFNLFSHGDRVVFLDFLRERRAEIVVDDVKDDY